MTMMTAEPPVRIDTAQLNRSVNLLDLIGSATSLRKVAGTQGGEFAGPCPFCGGTDRFHVQPERHLWFCRACTGEQWQDVIAYVMRRENLSFPEACQRLGASPPPPARSPVTPASVLPRITPVPSEAWQAAGVALVERSIAALWSEAGSRARDYLHARGLSDATLQAWQVGYQPVTEHTPAAAWGLHGKSVQIERGIVLPWWLGGELWQIKIRRATSARRQKYTQIRGGHPSLYGAHTLTFPVAFLVEGEFDCMLLHQEAGFIVGVATLGSASAKLLDLRAVAALLPVQRILVALDRDHAGRDGMAKLETLSARCGRASIAAPHEDLTDMWTGGYRLRDWAEHAAWVDAHAQGRESLIPPGVHRPEAGALSEALEVDHGEDHTSESVLIKSSNTTVDQTDNRGNQDPGGKRANSTDCSCPICAWAGAGRDPATGRCTDHPPYVADPDPFWAGVS
jgi:DNA primase